MPNGGTEEDAELPGFPPVEPEEEEEVVITKPDISTLVNKILEGLRGDAFLLARDVGLDALTSEEGLEDLLQKMKAFVFPRANYQRRRSCSALARGPLSRQSGESMLSYTNRRKRWWSVLQELDSTMILSDSLRAELLLGLSRQEILVTKAYATPKNELRRILQGSR